MKFKNEKKTVLRTVYFKQLLKNLSLTCTVLFLSLNVFETVSFFFRYQLALCVEVFYKIRSSKAIASTHGKVC